MREMTGNNAADVYAVRGTEAAIAFSPPHKKDYKTATSLYRFLLTVAGDWIDDATPYENWNSSEIADQPPAPTELPLHPEQPYSIDHRWGNVSCLKCKICCRELPTRKKKSSTGGNA